MARGKVKGSVPLKDTVPDNEIVRNGEVRNEPIYPFPDGIYGISGEYRNYSLVKKRLAYRTGTEEDGINMNRVIEYAIWEDVPCYAANIEDIFESYAQILNLTEFKSNKLKGEIKELVDIHRHTDEMISTALKGFSEYLTNEQRKKCQLTDSIIGLEAYITQLKDRLDKYKKLDHEIDNMYKTIKEKTTIIVNRDKPKDHKVKLEEN
jgi:hypothetical protein